MTDSSLSSLQSDTKILTELNVFVCARHDNQMELLASRVQEAWDGFQFHHRVVVVVEVSVRYTDT